MSNRQTSHFVRTYNNILLHNLDNLFTHGYCSLFFECCWYDCHVHDMWSTAKWLQCHVRDTVHAVHTHFTPNDYPYTDSVIVKINTFSHSIRERCVSPTHFSVFITGLGHIQTLITGKGQTLVQDINFASMQLLQVFYTHGKHFSFSWQYTSIYLCQHILVHFCAHHLPLSLMLTIQDSNSKQHQY